MQLAQELARLLDHVETERKDFAALNGLVPDNLAQHWQLTVNFLDILRRAWPDILSCGKGISGGYAPLAAMLIADRVSEAFWGEPEAGVQFWAGHTYGGNPVSCAVGEAAVRYLLDNDLIGNAERVGNDLADRLTDIATRQPAIAEVRGVGMLRGVAFTEPIGQAVYDAARRLGLLTRPGADWVGVAPPLVTTKDEADEIAAILAEAIAEVA